MLSRVFRSVAACLFALLPATGLAQTFGGALSCDGIDDIGTAAFSSSGTLAELTVEAWVNHAAYSNLGSAVSANALGTGSFALGQGQLMSAMIPGFTISSGPTTTAFGTEIMPLNTWVHLAGTYDGATIRVFVNGQPAGTTALSGGISVSNVRFCRFAVSDNALDGAIDEIRIWTVIRTDQEIASNFNLPLAGSESGLFAYYQFDEMSGQDLFDSSPNARDGLLGETAAVASDDPVRIVSTVPSDVLFADGFE